MRYKIVTIYQVDYFELERFAKEIYGLDDYSFVATEECGNDSEHRFRVNGKVDSWDADNEVAILNTTDVPCYANGLLLNMLCRDGHIPKGEYLVIVCW